MATGQVQPHRSDRAATLRGVFWLVVLAVIILYIFFGILGAFRIGNALPLTILVGVLAGCWLVHAMAERRHHDEDERDPRMRAARQRRGF